MFKHKNFKCTNDGVSNYFWPVSRDKVARLIRRMVKESAYHLKNVSACEDNKFYEDLKLRGCPRCLTIILAYHGEKELFKLAQAKSFD